MAIIYGVYMKKQGTGSGSIPEGALTMESGDPLVTEGGDYIIME